MTELDEEALAVRELSHQFVRDVVEPAAAEIDRSDRFPVEIYTQMGELGLLGMTLPEKYGGIGASAKSWAVVEEELARGSTAVSDALMVNKLMSDVILSNAAPEDVDVLLPQMARGETICAIAQTEPDAGSDVAAVKTTATAVGGGYHLNGSKQFITLGGICDYAVVVATVDKSLGGKGIALFLADATSEGFVRGAEDKIMGVRGLATGELVFQNCFVPNHRVLSPAGQGLKRALVSLNSGRIGIAAQCVGIARAALDLALSYARDRIAFGKPIAEQQAIQFMLAEMATAIQSARLMVHCAAELRDAGEDFLLEAAQAKLLASEMAGKVVDDALQIHGGQGYSKDSAIERLYRDVRVHRLWEGTTQIQKLIIARQLLAQ